MENSSTPTDVRRTKLLRRQRTISPRLNQLLQLFQSKAQEQTPVKRLPKQDEDLFDERKSQSFDSPFNCGAQNRSSASFDDVNCNNVGSPAYPSYVASLGTDHTTQRPSDLRERRRSSEERQSGSCPRTPYSRATPSKRPVLSRQKSFQKHTELVEGKDASAESPQEKSSVEQLRSVSYLLKGSSGLCSDSFRQESKDQGYFTDSSVKSLENLHEGTISRPNGSDTHRENTSEDCSWRTRHENVARRPAKEDVLHDFSRRLEGHVKVKVDHTGEQLSTPMSHGSTSVRPERPSGTREKFSREHSRSLNRPRKPSRNEEEIPQLPYVLRSPEPSLDEIMKDKLEEKENCNSIGDSVALEGSAGNDRPKRDPQDTCESVDNEEKFSREAGQISLMDISSFKCNGGLKDGNVIGKQDESTEPKLDRVSIKDILSSKSDHDSSKDGSVGGKNEETNEEKEELFHSDSYHHCYSIDCEEKSSKKTGQTSIKDISSSKLDGVSEDGNISGKRVESTKTEKDLLNSDGYCHDGYSVHRQETSSKEGQRAFVNISSSICGGRSMNGSRKKEKSTKLEDDLLARGNHHRQSSDHEEKHSREGRTNSNLDIPMSKDDVGSKDGRGGKGETTKPEEDVFYSAGGYRHRCSTDSSIDLHRRIRTPLTRSKSTIVLKPPRRLCISESERGMQLDDSGVLQFLNDIKGIKTCLLKLKRELQEAPLQSPLSTLSTGSLRFFDDSFISPNSTISLIPDANAGPSSGAPRKLVRRTTVDSCVLGKMRREALEDAEKMASLEGLSTTVERNQPSSELDGRTVNNNDGFSTVTERLRSVLEDKQCEKERTLLEEDKHYKEKYEKLEKELMGVKDELQQLRQDRSCHMIVREELEHELQSKNYTIKLLQTQLEGQEFRNEVEDLREQVRGLQAQVKAQQVEKARLVQNGMSSSSQLDNGSKNKRYWNQLRMKLKDAMITSDMSVVSLS